MTLANVPVNGSFRAWASDGDSRHDLKLRGGIPPSSAPDTGLAVLSLQITDWLSRQNRLDLDVDIRGRFERGDNV